MLAGHPRLIVKKRTAESFRPFAAAGLSVSTVCSYGFGRQKLGIRLGCWFRVFKEKQKPTELEVPWAKALAVAWYAAVLWPEFRNGDLPGSAAAAGHTLSRTEPTNRRTKIPRMRDSPNRCMPPKSPRIRHLVKHQLSEIFLAQGRFMKIF